MLTGSSTPLAALAISTLVASCTASKFPRATYPTRLWSPAQAPETYPPPWRSTPACTGRGSPAWEHTANTHLAPLLGIEPLPVGISVTTHPAYRGEDDDGIVSAWKARALSQAYPDRALVWIDDDNHAYATDPTWNTAHRWAAECDPRSGLTPAVMNRVETWLMHASRSM